MKWNECVLNPRTFSYQSRLFCLWSKLLNVCAHISWWQHWETQQQDFIILFLPVIMETSHRPMEWWQVRKIVLTYKIEFGDTWMDFLGLRESWPEYIMNFRSLNLGNAGKTTAYWNVLWSVMSSETIIVIPDCPYSTQLWAAMLLNSCVCFVWFLF